MLAACLLGINTVLRGRSGLLIGKQHNHERKRPLVPITGSESFLMHFNYLAP